MKRGQQYAVMKLLQAGVLATVMAVIIFGIVSNVKDQVPTSDPYTISCELLGSAYSAADTGEFFVREALLVSQEFNSKSLRQCASLPSSAKVELHCREPFCTYEGEELGEGGSCDRRGCDSMSLTEGDKITVCTICETKGYGVNCEVWFGEDKC